MRFFYEKIRDGLLAGNCLLECLYLVTALPRNAQLFPSHVAVGSQLTVLRLAQIQHLDDAGRGQTENLRNDLLQNMFRNLAGAEGVYPNGNRIGNADGIGELHFAALCQTGSHDVLGDVPCSVCGGTVYLRRVTYR